MSTPAWEGRQPADLEVALASLSAIPPGEGRTFQVAGERIAIFHSRGGGVFATQAECPHRGGPLADGLLGGRVLICPLHAWKFDLETGDALAGSCSLKTYAARVDAAGRILVRMDPTAVDDAHREPAVGDS
jgi:nitrite reductase (NADH) small subunit